MWPSVVTAPPAATVSSAFLSVMATPKQNPWVLAFLSCPERLPQGGDVLHDLRGPLRQVFAARFFPPPREREGGPVGDLYLPQTPGGRRPCDQGRHDRCAREVMEQSNPRLGRDSPLRVPRPLGEDSDGRTGSENLDRSFDRGDVAARAVDWVRVAPANQRPEDRNPKELFLGHVVHGTFQPDPECRRIEIR